MMDAHGWPDPTGPTDERFADALAHLDDPAFDGDREATIADCARAGIDRIVVAGYSPETAPRALPLRRSSIRVGVGLHPWFVDAADGDALEAAFEALPGLLARADAFGEIGLDRVSARRRGEGLDRQAAALRRALALGREIGLPIVLHVVRAHAEAAALVRDAGPLPPLVVHGFVGDRVAARAWLSLGAALSFGHAALGSPRTLEVAAALPRDRLLLESDAPHGARRGERTTPHLVRAIGAAIAGASGRDLRAIAGDSWANAGRIFFP